MLNFTEPDKIIVIDDDEFRVGTEIERYKNHATFAKPDLRQTAESEAEQSSSHKSDPLNPDSNSDFRESLSQRLTHTITAILGSIYGMSSEDVNKLMEVEKGVITELHDSVKTVSRVFENFSSKEKQMILQKNFANTYRGVEIPRDVSSVNKEISENISINNEILMNLQRIKRDFVDLKKVVQQDSNRIVIPENSQNIVSETSSSETRLQTNGVNNQENSYVVRIKDKSETTLQTNVVNNQENSHVAQMKDKSETTLKENSVPNQENSFVAQMRDKFETTLQTNSVNNQENSYVSQTKDKQESTSTSGIKIGDNWELPIMVVDSDEDETVIEIDSDEEEIQEYKEMMSLEDVDCIEIGKDEFEVVVNARKGDSEITDDCESDDETFIPIMPGVTKKRRRSLRLRKARRRASAPANPLRLLTDDDPSKWRKDLPAFPIISDIILRTWATGFLTFRKEWERLEYLGDKVLMFCVLRFATTKYLRYYTPSDIKVVTTFLVSNKLLAAYALTLGLDRQNQMQGLGITKKVADAFEAYIGAYYLSDGEAATTRYLDQLMSPLFELVLSSIQTGRDPHKIMNVMANYFNMGFLIRLPRLSK